MSEKNGETINEICVGLNSEMMKVKQVHIDYSGNTQSVSINSAHVIQLYIFISKCLSKSLHQNEKMEKTKHWTHCITSYQYTRYINIFNI